MYVTNPIDFRHADTAALSLAKHQQIQPQKVRDIAVGNFLFREGDKAQNLFEVQSGVLRLTRVLANGRRQVIAFGYPGDIIGFPDGDNHHADCDAITEVSVLVHGHAVLDDARLQPELHKKLLKAAMREISAMQDHFMTLGRKSVTEKLASFLLVLGDRVGEPLSGNLEFDLPMCRSDIADFLCVSPETVSRIFTQFRKRKIIAINQIKRVVLLDREQLLELAEMD
ncbi:helix-turn-helix domain-containing protein [Aliiroseovarius sp. M344]|uniref:helix-turn-helix domain-containing protein n=1 Tax=Aliiroseovarius sp. M344 TaxID=2867010 RepID=UPI0021ADFB17|nr:helix-turn-helix domain-containing protein [Aliiroseovarius sp. M344]UWQ14232.1 helix-turn-helix domain-containing protein [Aliiroseovarius sp. M344]